MTFDDYVLFFMTFVFHGWGLTVSFFEFVYILYYTDWFGWGFLSSVFVYHGFLMLPGWADLYFLDFFFVIFLDSLGGRVCTSTFFIFILCYHWFGLGQVLESCIFLFGSSPLVQVST